MSSQLKAALDRLQEAVWLPSTDDDPDPMTVIRAAEAVLRAAGRKPRSRYTDD